jgi:hypothetical protein
MDIRGYSVSIGISVCVSMFVFCTRFVVALSVWDFLLLAPTDG